MTVSILHPPSLAQPERGWVKRGREPSVAH